MATSIVRNTYFKNDLYIPKAKPSLTDDVSDVSADLLSFINEYEAECLIKCLGLPLFLLLKAEFDFAEANLLKTTADVKWDKLLNGESSYVDPYGKSVRWRGIRYKSDAYNQAAEYDKSFLAYYIYYFYQEDQDIRDSGVGFQKNDAKNAQTVSGRPKVIKAWSKFIEMVQGYDASLTIYEKHNLIGVDYYGQNANDTEVSLYKFIKDSNKLVADTYLNFNPKNWRPKNQFDI